MVLFSCISDGLSDVKIQGNGDVEQKQIIIESISEVETNGAYEIIFIQDTLWKVELEAESNILPLIEVYKVQNTLIIENKENYSFDLNQPILVKIHHGGLSSISFNGSGSVDLGYFTGNSITTILSGEGSITGNIESSQVDFILSGSGSVNAKIDCDDLEASVSGQGNFVFEGFASNAVYSISGVSMIDALKLEMNSVWVTISGVGDAHLKVSEELHVTLSGVGNIYYLGDPELDINISGTGKLVKL